MNQNSKNEKEKEVRQTRAASRGFIIGEFLLQCRVLTVTPHCNKYKPTLYD